MGGFYATHPPVIRSILPCSLPRHDDFDTRPQESTVKEDKHDFQTWDSNVGFMYISPSHFIAVFFVPPILTTRSLFYMKDGMRPV